MCNIITYLCSKKPFLYCKIPYIYVGKLICMWYIWICMWYICICMWYICICMWYSSIYMFDKFLFILYIQYVCCKSRMYIVHFIYMLQMSYAYGMISYIYLIYASMKKKLWAEALHFSDKLLN